jgi:hypothetical protein
MILTMINRCDWCRDHLRQPREAQFALEKLGAGYRESDIDRAMDEVFKTPGALNRIPAFICARCGKTMPCLGVSKKPKQGGSRA